jgi:hypothetical protein
MKTYRWVDVEINIFVTSALVGAEWSVSRPCHFTPMKESTVPVVSVILSTALGEMQRWNLLNSRFDPSTIQTVITRHAAYATAAVFKKGILVPWMGQNITNIYILVS